MCRGLVTDPDSNARCFTRWILRPAKREWLLLHACFRRGLVMSATWSPMLCGAAHVAVAVHRDSPYEISAAVAASPRRVLPSESRTGCSTIHFRAAAARTGVRRTVMVTTQSELCPSGIAIADARMTMVSRIAVLPSEIFNASVPTALPLPAKTPYPLAVTIAPRHFAGSRGRRRPVVYRRPAHAY